jgi:hypothetical protein
VFLGALLLALAAARSNITLATPAGSGEVSLAVVEWEGGSFLGFLQSPSDHGAAAGRIDSLVEYRNARMTRHLGGPAIPGLITVHAVYPETAGMRRGPVRKLAFLERTTGGFWFDQWDTEVRNGRACLTPEAIEHFRTVIRGRTPDRNGQICLHL